ncbi:MAG: PAS domain-containing protein [Bacillota bacterium]
MTPPKKRFESPTGEASEEGSEENIMKEGEVALGPGSLSLESLNAMLNTLPLDLTFVDKDGYVKYFTTGEDRIFDRPATIIGRHVNQCHPPASVHVVEEIVNAFKSGKKDHEDFRIQIKDKFVHIRYFAVRNKDGEYLGTLEMTQDIDPLRAFEGEKRLISDD